MSQTRGDLAALSRFFFRAPDWSASLFFTVLVAAVVGIGVFDVGTVLDDAFLGMVYVGVPTVVAAFLTPPIDQALGGQFTYNRSALLAFVCEIIVVCILAAAAVVTTLTGVDQGFVWNALSVALASIFAVRLFVILAVSGRSMLTAAAPASLQTVVAAALVTIYNGAFEHGLLAALCAVYAGGVYVFVFAIDRPWRRGLDVSVLDFVQGFVGHAAEGSNELETFFETIGETATVPVTVLSVRRRDGTEKARFVVPMVHPGPVGEIGGGNLPERIAGATPGLAFPLHGTAGHDFNLVTEREVESVLAAAERATDRIEYAPTATESARETEGDSTLLGQAVGDGQLLVATHAPEPADDIEFGVGLAVAAEARGAGAGTVAVADAHNCNDGVPDGSAHVAPGSRRAFDLATAADRLAGRLAAADRKPLAVGVAATDTEWDRTDGIGPLGVRAAVFEVGDHRTAYVLVDGNNMNPGVREAIRAAVGDLAVDDVEAMTTDTHVVNAVAAANQVGAEIDADRLAGTVADLVEEALSDLEPATAGLSTERTEVTVFGNDRTEALAATANAMVRIGGVLLVVVLCAATAVSLLVFLLT